MQSGHQRRKLSHQDSHKLHGSQGRLSQHVPQDRHSPHDRQSQSSPHNRHSQHSLQGRHSQSSLQNRHSQHSPHDRQSQSSPHNQHSPHDRQSQSSPHNRHSQHSLQGRHSQSSLQNRHSQHSSRDRLSQHSLREQHARRSDDSLRSLHAHDPHSDQSPERHRHRSLQDRHGLHDSRSSSERNDLHRTRSSSVRPDPHGTLSSSVRHDLQNSRSSNVRHDTHSHHSLLERDSYHSGHQHHRPTVRQDPEMTDKEARAAKINRLSLLGMPFIGGGVLVICGALCVVDTIGSDDVGIPLLVLGSVSIVVSVIIFLLIYFDVIYKPGGSRIDHRTFPAASGLVIVCPSAESGHSRPDSDVPPIFVTVTPDTEPVHETTDTSSLTPSLEHPSPGSALPPAKSTTLS